MADLPEIVFASSDPAESRRISGLLKSGKLRALVPRVYTSNIADTPAAIVRRNIWYLLGNLFPGSLVSHRTAMEHRLSPGNSMYMTARTRRVYRWPGVNIRIAQGHGPVESDSAYYPGLFVSSFERACLENLSPSRSVDGETRTVDQELIEQRLLDILNTRGETALNQVRDKAHDLSLVLEMPGEYARLNQIIGWILSSRPFQSLKSSVAKAHAKVEPYDSGRIALFDLLAAELKSRSFHLYPEKTKHQEQFSHIAFYESYFSNYIEGTTFRVEEAVDIVYHDVMIERRIADTHDIRGTYRICADRHEMQIIPSGAEDLISILRRRHSAIMSGRPDKDPGAFKLDINRAGDTVFVEPRHVNGTLKMGYQIYDSILDPVARALFMMFLISEIHPFTDGNGRIARIMMNAELVHHGQTKILIPTVYRDDYMLALRRLSRQHDPQVYIRMLLRALDFSHSLDPTSLNGLRDQLNAADAFKESEGNMLRWP